jgi:6-phosphogluconolactonase
VTAPRIHVSDDPAATVAEILADTARAGGSLVLTGGRTAGAAYARAAALEPDWSRARVWWSDERCVPPEDERSNYRLAEQTLFSALDARPEVHRIAGELGPVAGAAAYEPLLPDDPYDLVLLGLGSDSHIASLFPVSPQFAERERRVAGGPAGLDPFVDRISLTLPELLRARRIVVLATGDEKAAAVDRCFAHSANERYPGSLLQTGDATLDVIVDRAARGDGVGIFA